MSAPSPVANALLPLGRTVLLLTGRLLPRLGMRPDRPLGRVMAAGLSVLAAGLSAAGLAATGPVREPPAPVEAVEALPAPVVPDETPDAVLPDESPLLHYAVRPDDTVLSLLSALGITEPEAMSFIFENPRLQPLLMPQPGQHVTANVTPEGRLEHLRLYMDGPGPQDTRTIEISRTDDGLTADVLPFSFSTMETIVSGESAGGFRRTAALLGIPEDIVEQLIEVWDGSADPLRTLSDGASLRVVFEQKFADGQFVKNGRLLAAQIVDDAGVHEAFWFDDGRRPGAFYTLDGRSASQTFLRVPLDIKDVSSEFSPLRRHPITGQLRPHNGTDLRAPMGSRILAAADGRVTRVAYQARGYGNYVEIDHGLGRRTLYAHMQRVQKGIRPGVQVEKGQLIGLVGRTGLATGPHLHYELLIDGVQTNPATANLPDTENLSSYQLAQLRARAHPFEELFERQAEIEGRPSPAVLIARAAEESAKRRAEAAPEADSGNLRVRTVGNDVKGGASAVRLGGSR